tara:strand:+ start:999 stop:1172 length:174 start_codon:yes stop_codon:yes gene_type:complete
MENIDSIEDKISTSLTEILQKSSTLDSQDQIAILQEFKESIHREAEEEEIWVINCPI